MFGMYILPEMYRLSQPPSLASVNNQVELQIGVAMQYAKQGAKSKNMGWNSSSLRSSPSANEENNVLTAKQNLFPSTSKSPGQEEHTAAVHLYSALHSQVRWFFLYQLCNLMIIPLKLFLHHSKKRNVVVVTRGLLFSFHESTVEMYGDTLRVFFCSPKHCIAPRDQQLYL